MLSVISHRNISHFFNKKSMFPKIGKGIVNTCKDTVFLLQKIQIAQKTQ